MRSRFRLCCALLGVLLLVNLGVGSRVFSDEAAKRGDGEAFEKISVLMRVLHLIRKDYVSADKIDYTRLVYTALKGMVGSLDPFSSFMTPDEYGGMMEETEGEFGGIGVVISMREGILTIVTPIEDTPGSRAGLLAGDQIVTITGKSTKGMAMSEVTKLLKGEPGTVVEIAVRRPSTDDLRDLTIERALIPVVTVKSAKILPETKIGYVRITQFSEPTAERLQGELRRLAAQDPQGLVIDLRNNPGGLLVSAVDVCSFFLPPGKTVVSTEGRRPSQKQEFKTRRGGYHFPRCPVAILINGGSASAAEIVSGCLKDYGRAILVGEKTFGKGSVQNVIELPDGSALRLTTAMYYTPSRRVIHEHGIEPDIAVKLSEKEVRALVESQYAIPGVDEKTKAVDPQLERAVETLQSYSRYQAARKDRFEKPVPATPGRASSE
ncbi:MAG: S41 family peptidase [Lentisphaeria bacterium]|nr:S41 family peptidase [Lentisphaeria bacterium]